MKRYIKKFLGWAGSAVVYLILMTALFATIGFLVGVLIRVINVVAG